MNYVLTCRRTCDRFSVGARAPASVSPCASSTQEGPVELWTGVAGEQLPGLGAWLVLFPGMCSPHSPSRGGGRSRLILQRSAHMQPPPGAWSPALSNPPRGCLGACSFRARLPVWPRCVTGAQPRGDHRVPALTTTCHLGVMLTLKVWLQFSVLLILPSKPSPAFLFVSCVHCRTCTGRKDPPTGGLGSPAGALCIGVATGHRQSSEGKAAAY